jgi:glycosyltransferase involved in cell wall biosynthesis
MRRGIFISDSYPVAEGHGGGVVSYYELLALARFFHPTEIYTRPLEERLIVDIAYPGDPFIFDHYVAANIDPILNRDIALAKIYGAGLPVTMKLLRAAGAKVIPTVPAHHLKISVDEQIELSKDASCYGRGVKFNLPQPHVTNDHLFRITMKGVTDYATTVVCPSSTCVAFLKEYFGPNPTKGDIEIIPHGTDIPEKIADETSRGGAFTVLHVGQIGGDKGDRYLQRAWASFLPALKNARLFFMGNNANAFGAGFEATGLGTFNSLNVTCFSGAAATRESKEIAFLKASVYVQPSITEGWGIPVGEAMAHGIPVIVTDKTGAVDMVTDGVDGFVIPIRDPDAITDKIQYFYDNPGEVSRMGKNARAKAEKYDWKTIEDRYADLYRRVLE